MVPKSINDIDRWSRPLTGETIAAVNRVVERAWFVLGPEVEQFEREFAQYLHVNHVVSVGNGSDALALALRAVGVEGKKVIACANAGAYGTLAVLACGASPVFVDVERETGLMDLALAEKTMAVGEIAAVIVTHLYGRMHSLDRFVQVARRNRVVVIEDCAQAHGARRGACFAGTIGDIGCFSFYPTKNLGALGDAGAIATNDGEIAARVAKLRQYGWTEKYRIGLTGGKNSRLDELQAAILRTRLPHLDIWNEQRREVATGYRDAIAHPDVFIPPIGGEEYVAHLFVVRVRNRLSFVDHLRKHKVPFDIHYPIPDHQQPAFADNFGSASLPETAAWAQNVVSLPCFPGMRDEELRFVSNVINEW